MGYKVFLPWLHLTGIHFDSINSFTSAFDNSSFSYFFNMSKILTVVGATGAQGGSVVASALKSGTYKVRGVTRNVESTSAKALTAQGVEMVTADTNDLESLVKAFEVRFSSGSTVAKSLTRPDTNRSRVLTPYSLSPTSLPLSLPRALRKLLPLSPHRVLTAQRRLLRLPHLNTTFGAHFPITRRSPAVNTLCLTLRARPRSMCTFARIRHCWLRLPSSSSPTMPQTFLCLCSCLTNL
jgi:hypothetical protein